MNRKKSWRRRPLQDVHRHGDVFYQAGWEEGYRAGYRRSQSGTPSHFSGTSIIIPIGSENEFSSSTLRTLAAATPHPYELLLADYSISGSVRAYAARKSGLVRYVDCRDSGSLNGALDQALARAHGAYICILSPGAVPPPEWLAVLITILKRDQAEIVCGRFRNKDRNELQIVDCLVFRREMWKPLGNQEQVDSGEHHLMSWLRSSGLADLKMLDASDQFHKRKDL
ncbi:glycosyltransferase family A protein [Paenibacillus lemnae]|uniref:Glycosyltransferase family 2 protein n=1 Tax=Paenibacillus lemnae TaxID=1330551 RepID=A0A848M549_PAELE|nr:glycosyltransferase family A protein [Paenibacillus lemnae]NMO95232.1 glycosyltransferase family 2 protein [Paenibacillus lemnae]